jgi:hypothetical protein
MHWSDLLTVSKSMDLMKPRLELSSTTQRLVMHLLSGSVATPPSPIHAPLKRQPTYKMILLTCTIGAANNFIAKSIHPLNLK